MAKQIPSLTEWRIIGVSGATADGREISASELQEMAESYDPEVYTAKINLEHFRFLYDDWAGAYGDVRELKAEPWAKDPSKTALLAKFSVLPALQNVWDKGSKVFTSMEIQSNFAKTGKAYLVGVAITDSPASLGTTQNFSLTAKKAQENNIIFSAYKEWEMSKENESTKVNQVQVKETVSIEDVENIFSKLFKQFFGKKEDEQPEQTEEPAATAESKKQDYAAQIAELQQANADAAKLYEATISELNNLKQQFADLQNRLETEPVSGERTPHGGANEAAKVGW